MRLSDWCKQHNIQATSPTSERSAVSVVVDQTHPGRSDLFHLDDYTVSSCCGIVIWLIPGPSYTARKKLVDQGDVEHVRAINQNAERYVGKTIFDHAVRARYKIVRVGIDKVQAVSEKPNGARLWSDPITFAELQQLEQTGHVAIVDSRETLLENSLWTLVEICRHKVSPTDEVILSCGRTNERALIDAIELLKGER